MDAARRILGAAVFAAVLPATVIVFLPRWALAASGRPGESAWRALGLIPIAVGGVLVIWTLVGSSPKGAERPRRTTLRGTW